jgi:hypothetical protein
VTEESSPPPVGAGDFIWSNFPKRERPEYPSDEPHLALCLRRFRQRSEGYVLAAVYTKPLLVIIDEQVIEDTKVAAIRDKHSGRDMPAAACRDSFCTVPVRTPFGIKCLN